MIALISSYLNSLFSDNRVLSRRLALTGVLAHVVLCSSLQAQIVRCGDTWTNQPCPGGTPAFTEKVSTPAPVNEESLRKRDAVHDLTSTRYKTREKFGVDLDAGDVERYCELQTTTIEQCLARIDAFRQRLDTRVIEEQKLQLQKRELELAEGRRNNGTKSETNQVLIINNLYLRTPTPTFPPYIPPNSGLIPRPQPARKVPAPTRNEFPGDVRAPLPGNAPK